MARWQGREVPDLERVTVAVFAGNHGVAAHGVSAYPQAVTEQMVMNFAAGGAAINQIAKLAEAQLRVVPIDLDRPTGDLTVAPAMDIDEFLAAVDIGYRTVPPDGDLLAIGEMGIGNITAASALCTALLGHGAAYWVGRGTGVDDAGLERKCAAVEAAVRRPGAIVDDPLAVAATLGGRDLPPWQGRRLRREATKSRCCSTDSSRPRPSSRSCGERKLSAPAATAIRSPMHNRLCLPTPFNPRRHQKTALIKRRAASAPSSELEPYWFLVAVPICPKLGARRR
jgi:Phosphoribosyltransferase